MFFLIMTECCIEIPFSNAFFDHWVINDNKTMEKPSALKHAFYQLLFLILCLIQLEHRNKSERFLKEIKRIANY